LHLGCLAVLLALVQVAWNYLGRPFPSAFWCAVALPVVHQIFVWLAWLDRGSLGLPPAPQAALTTLLVIPGVYAMYSVQLYFGMQRAAGADHFDSRYREMPLVEKGIFRFTNNGMYLYAFFLFWAVAVGFNSAAALVVAAFSHLYIWVHFYATEKPDMEFIYDPGNAS
jgi:hypothetical protein